MVSGPISRPIMSSGIELNDTISIFDGLSIASDITKSTGNTILTLFLRAFLMMY